MRTTGLSRQLALSLSGMVLGVMLLLHVGFYLFYTIVTRFNPALVSPTVDSWPPTPSEWALIAILTVLGLFLAVHTALRLSRRILQPLNSVAESARQLARGDLSVRASSEDRSLGEAVGLVDDFNSMAERLERMTCELVTWNAAIAHELRTPVTILRGRLQGLAEGVFKPDEALFRSLLGQVEGLSRLIDDLRTLSLADSGHLSLQRAPVDLAAEIRAVVELLGPELQAAGLVPELTLEARTTCCDGARLRQVVLALLENARRHASPGALRISTARTDGAFVLSVEDAGPGISAELAAHIFEAFVRGEESRSRQSGGTGLGLAVVRAIVHAHHGRVACLPGSHGGTCFRVWLPEAS
ncbi:MAG: ATP-binding protein [Zoogloea sp.]|jgi:signal transduction histidine kinase|uniref:ATP-binding protein n=1 Tax=Zoogloea sp. TaxID=49181 RepID=UPI002609CD05|nr:ATP-binding protein [Zoogloea sp.]MDD3325843.1 ATP-binding protein [Zoogloea sp.]